MIKSSSCNTLVSQYYERSKYISNVLFVMPYTYILNDSIKVSPTLILTADHSTLLFLPGILVLGECKISINVIPLISRNFFLARHYYRLSLLQTLNHSPQRVRNKGSWLYKYEKTVIFHLFPAMNKSWPSQRALFKSQS